MVPLLTPHLNYLKALKNNPGAPFLPCFLHLLILFVCLGKQQGQLSSDALMDAICHVPQFDF